MYDLSAKEAFNCFKVSILEKSVEAIVCVYIFGWTVQTVEEKKKRKTKIKSRRNKRAH